MTRKSRMRHIEKKKINFVVNLLYLFVNESTVVYKARRNGHFSLDEITKQTQFPSSIKIEH